jgi:syntaxin 8
MASTTSERLQLLQDHVRLSLLERNRALSLKVEPDSRNTYDISRSLDTLHQGIEQLEKEQRELEDTGELYVSPAMHGHMRDLY